MVWPWERSMQKHEHHSGSRRSKRTGASCCGSRPSVSSSPSDDDDDEGIGRQLDRLSKLVHGMVQARRERKMIGERGPGIHERRRRRDEIGAGSGGRCIVLIAMDKSSYDLGGDFRRSILEVIASEGLEEPRELRSLLNCYMAMNSREHRQVILEAFHEICSSVFL